MLEFAITSRLMQGCSLTFSLDKGSFLPSLVFRTGSSAWRISINLL